MRVIQFLAPVRNDFIGPFATEESAKRWLEENDRTEPHVIHDLVDPAEEMFAVERKPVAVMYPDDPRVQYMSFERHKLDEVWLIDRKGKKETKREGIQKALDKYGSFVGRKDIGMVNVWERPNMGGECQQYCVEPTPEGEPHWGGAEPFLTDEQKDELRELNRLVIAAELEAGWPKGTLTSNW